VEWLVFTCLCLGVIKTQLDWAYVGLFTRYYHRIYRPAGQLATYVSHPREYIYIYILETTHSALMSYLRPSRDVWRHRTWINNDRYCCKGIDTPTQRSSVDKLACGQRLTNTDSCYYLVVPCVTLLTWSLTLTRWRSFIRWIKSGVSALTEYELARKNLSVPGSPFLMGVEWRWG